MNVVSYLARLLILLALFHRVDAAEPENPKPKIVKALSFVAVAEPKLPSAANVRASLEQRLGDVKIDGIETDDKQVILIRVRGGTVSIGLIPAPLPKGEMDHMCKWAWYWRTACETMATHQAHLHVMVLGTDLDKIDAALLQTNVVASLMDGNALASYWGTSLQSKDAFLKQSAKISRDNLPVWLWINFRLTNDAVKGWTFSTQGMEAFELYEIESRDADVDGRKLFTLMAGMAEYLITNGPIIKDGETIGDSPAENIRVRHAPSYWNEGKTTYRVIFPQR